MPKDGENLRVVHEIHRHHLRSALLHFTGDFSKHTGPGLAGKIPRIDSFACERTYWWVFIVEVVFIRAFLTEQLSAAMAK